MTELKSLVLRLTEECNLGCAYCYADAKPGGVRMMAETACRAVELACPPGGRLRVQFTGGEPLTAGPRIGGFPCRSRPTGPS